MKNIRREKIIEYSHQHLKLDGLIPYLKRNNTFVEKEQTMTGDAPKLFIREYEYGVAYKSSIKKWPAYIAKVGHKWYPVESIMEQLLTDLGKLYGFNVADSKLVLASGQLRFMSRYFLNKEERLMHGAEIYAAHLNGDLKFVEEVEDKKLSSDFFTLSFTYDALKATFEYNFDVLFGELLKMLVFGAITGNNDRHFYNWGVIVNIRNRKKNRFAPIYDTARALFWNRSDDDLVKSLNHKRMDSVIKKYSNNSKPKMGIEQTSVHNHFEFVDNMLLRFPQFGDIILTTVKKSLSINEAKLIDTKYRYILCEDRRSFIKDCLNFRKDKLKEIISQYD